MDQADAAARFRDMQTYLSWTDEDAHRVRASESLLSPAFPAIVRDFYDRIERHPGASGVLSGGADQVDRLKASLLRWLEELLRGPYDASYVARRWRVGLRHAEIGLDFVYYHLAMTCIRSNLQGRLHDSWDGDFALLTSTSVSLDKLLDLELALVGDAYQRAHSERQKQVERLATLGQIAGGLAHELRNPLNVIKTSAYYLQKAPQLSREKQEEHLRRIERHIGLADGVVSALDGFVSTPAPQPRFFPIKPAILDAVERSRRPDIIRMTLTGMEGLPAVHADEAQIGTVFTNLLRNACEAMPAGGSLEIHGECAGDLVEVSFRDSGPGIAPDDLAKIQDPFYTTKPRGLGLGLAVTRSILDRNHGSLRVASEIGRGSTFVVGLPARPLSTAPTSATNGDDPPPGGSQP